jgi:hypothetical protein
VDPDVRLSRSTARLPCRKALLERIFAVLVIGVGIYVALGAA